MDESLLFQAQEYAELWNEYGIASARLHQVRLMKALQGHCSSVSVKDSAKEESLRLLQQELGDCRRCGLCEGRTNVVFGVGNATTRLIFVGEGPGADEDAQGTPFVGRAGKLLTKIIEAMGQKREMVYIANIVKCRPPNNRTPLPDETEKCLPFLKAQIDIIAPQLIVALGGTAAKGLLGVESPMSSLRHRFHPLRWNSQVPVMPTYHPAYLLRNPSAKKEVWDDMKLVMEKLKEMK